MKDVLIIVVTYNRIKLLKRCLNHCVNIDYNKNDLIVIDNNSSDGTADFLNTHKFNFIKLNKNLGSSMGWYEGIKYALKLNYKYVWLMDDDGYPLKNSLNLLLKNFDNKFSCISSLVVSEDDYNKLVFKMPILNKKINNYLSLKFKTKNVNLIKKYSTNNTYEFAHLFNGSLIRLETIKKIGNVNEKYFMYGDEVDFFYRLKKIGKVVTCHQSLHIHPNVENRKCSKYWIYYYLKNSIIINKKYRNFFILRSLVIILLCILRVLSRNGLKEILSLLFLNKYNFYNAIFNGFRGRIGNDFR